MSGSCWAHGFPPRCLSVAETATGLQNKPNLLYIHFFHFLLIMRNCACWTYIKLMQFISANIHDRLLSHCSSPLNWFHCLSSYLYCNVFNEVRTRCTFNFSVFNLMLLCVNTTQPLHTCVSGQTSSYTACTALH